ncbi:MAG: rhodanese-like domain-containing protein [Anaerolineae bacterium]|nr:rhodanese-like domain-containing protein [Anaerolineae bacterium]
MSDTSPIPEEKPIEVQVITPDELKQRLDSGDEVMVVDMRETWEYQAGHIPGAVHVFIQTIPDRLAEFPKDKDIVFQCWHGNTSLQASAFLIDNGWDGKRIASLEGGIAGWVEHQGRDSLVTG